MNTVERAIFLRHEQDCFDKSVISNANHKQVGGKNEGKEVFPEVRNCFQGEVKKDIKRVYT